MCKYCSHLKELRAEDKKLYEMRKRLMDKAFLRKERLLRLALNELEFFVFVCLLIDDFKRADVVSRLVDDIQKELERQVI